jgi:hypothetical protein
MSFDVKMGKISHREEVRFQRSGFRSQKERGRTGGQGPGVRGGKRADRLGRDRSQKSEVRFEISEVRRQRAELEGAF